MMWLEVQVQSQNWEGLYVWTGWSVVDPPANPLQYLRDQRAAFPHRLFRLVRRMDLKFEEVTYVDAPPGEVSD